MGVGAVSYAVGVPPPLNSSSSPKPQSRSGLEDSGSGSGSRLFHCDLSLGSFISGRSSPLSPVNRNVFSCVHTCPQVSPTTLTTAVTPPRASGSASCDTCWTRHHLFTSLHSKYANIEIKGRQFVFVASFQRVIFDAAD